MRHHPPRQSGNTSWNGQRDRATQARFRAKLIKQAGAPRCQECGSYHRVQAHHDTETTGRLLCQACHRATDQHAR